jgi:diguanylate cyclase (GGDEF)-like protein/PAS domain S-box-containing protein
METPVFLNEPPTAGPVPASAPSLRRNEVHRTVWPDLTAVRGLVPDRPRSAGGGTVLLRAQLIDAIDDAVFAVDPDGAVLFMNAAAERLYGCSAAWAEGRIATDVLAWDLPDDIIASMVRCTDRASTWTGDLGLRSERPSRISVTIAPLHIAGATAAMVASARDTSERDGARAALHHRMTHDAATGLSNRQGAAQRLEELVDAHDGTTAMTVIRLDLEGLRSVSEAFGEPASCEVIKAVAHAVARSAHTGDIVARASDASFTICCPHLAGEAQAHDLAERLRQVATHPTPVGGTRVALRAAAGIVVDREGTRSEELLHRADIAASHQRERGRSESTLYDDALRQHILRQVDLEALIRRAIATGEVGLAYQPVVQLSDQTVVGAEALLRMVDDRGAAVPPPDIIRIAERTGLISDLGLVILRTACSEAARWQREHPERPIGVAVNVSASQLDDDGFPDEVERALRASGLDPARLTLEMTETVLMADSDRSTRQLARLKMIGVRLSADDFGTGYSSLAYLKRFPLDAIKADLSFVAGLPDSPEDVAVVAAIVAMADAVGLHVIAEGVENLRQLSELERLGCGFGQGYLWSRAVPGDELLELVEGRARSAPADDPAAPDDAGPDPAVEDRGVELSLRTFAHEVRNPLSVVTGLASLLEGDEHTTMGPIETGRHIRRAGERIERLLGTLDDIVAIDEGRLRLDARPLDLRALVADLVADLQHPSDVTIELHRTAGGPIWVHADPGRVGQVLANLFANAAKFSPPGGAIEAIVAERGTWADVSILDRGPGIADADVALAFRKFGRLDRTVEGTGMGLYLARGIARAHGGEVCYRRRSPAGGSIFNLRLPTTVRFPGSGGGPGPADEAQRAGPSNPRHGDPLLA